MARAIEQRASIGPCRYCVVPALLPGELVGGTPLAPPPCCELPAGAPVWGVVPGWLPLPEPLG
jgi:hypothetical protein